MIKNETTLIQAAGGTDIGRKSSRNEDFYLIDDQVGIYLVADGMGGYRYGQVASRSSCELFMEYYNPDEADFESQMKDILVKINAELYKQGAAKGDNKKMGTTFLACVMRGTAAHFCHAGDVRAYLLRDGEFRQLTRDHSTVADMVLLGYISADDALSHPLRHVVSRCLGTKPEIHPDYNRLEMENGDTLLLCSDGLWNMVQDWLIRETLEKTLSPEQAVEELITIANEAGGLDNITVMVITASLKART
ncbi:MAG: serine/threonine-protein phosphatase [bacterium]|nr:serine/threonine-protein phosphatase [bacterium]